MARARTPWRAPGRRQWLGASLLGGALAALGGWRARAQAHPGGAHALRPPGALPEPAFDGACLRCGLCVQACPFAVLQLADAGGPVAEGTPFFQARQRACRMCGDLPCQRVCPTAALGAKSLRVTQARIGLAAVGDAARCHSMNGAARCNACWRACPMQERAIRMVAGRTPLGGQFTPTVDAATCTGCGLCEQQCIADPPAITVRRSA